jgi:hypothetical protein
MFAVRGLEAKGRILGGLGTANVLLPMTRLDWPGRNAMGVSERVMVLLRRRVELEMVKAGKVVGWWIW